MEAIQKLIRNGNFTSSNIYALTKKDRSGKGWGAPALTYIKETNMERRLGRCLTDESRAKPLVWGNLLERIAYSKLPFDYELCSDDTLIHPIYDYWVGTPDVIAPLLVGDIKCPMTLKSFCQLVDPIYEGLSGMDAINRIREDHSCGEQYYWQLVSNGILTGSQYGELIVFMPYESELDEVRRIAADSDDCNWMNYDELPFLLDGGYYKNINSIRFEIPESDKALLTDCVVNAGKMLVQIP